MSANNIKFPEFWERLLQDASKVGDKMEGITVILHKGNNDYSIDHCGIATDDNALLSVLRCLMYDCIEDYNNGNVERTDYDDGE